MEIPLVYTIDDLVDRPAVPVAQEREAGTMNGESWIGKNPVGAILAILSLVGFMAMTMLLMFGQAIIPAANRDFFNMGYGAQISFATLAIGYYIGSSKGSAEKTAASNAAAITAAASAPASGTVVVK